MITLQHFLMVGAIVFALGIYTVVTRRNALGILLGTELVLNAAALNMVAFGYFGNKVVEGSVYALFVIVLAAAEAAVALAIGLMIFRNFNTIDATSVDEMRG
ncbi:NADH-quinone oxidoreductase subunit NuoK [Deltaproteobacteria bacterium PRO3]|nr:NADH-quinone oxidoreductase subunit NuoK [Deltaproteobacteria bacterium PRO3]